MVKMNLLCKLFGHKPPVYNKKGWFSPGEEYAQLDSNTIIDGIGRTHAIIISECPRCKIKFKLCRIHLPKNEKVFIAIEEIIKYNHLRNDLDAYCYAMYEWAIKGEPKPRPEDYGLKT